MPFSRCFFVLILCAAVYNLSSCVPRPFYETENVTISSDIRVLSSGFVEHHFTTDYEAYYLIGIERVRPGYDPSSPELQKQFMTLELDSANMAYLDWRRQLLQQGEFNVASFASHSLQYGETDYFFTGLRPNTDYWIYAFVVDPEKMVPKGKLHLVPVTTTEQSTVDVHFEYRLKNDWEYIYPLDHTAKHVQANFPYVYAIVDSVTIRKSGSPSPRKFFADSLNYLLAHPEEAEVQYGVFAHDIMLSEKNSLLIGPTYYTAIAGFDGLICHPAIYKFRLHDIEMLELYFYDTDTTNLAKTGTW
jgi:hypothetical protein